MRISIVGSKTTGWELVLGDGSPEPIGVVENATYEEALDVFAANWPEYMDQLDELKCDDFVGQAPVDETKRKTRVFGRERKRGSGARFRELISAGKTNEECLRIVREEFPDSKATLSDAAWNRAQLRKNPSAFYADGSKKV